MAHGGTGNNEDTKQNETFEPLVTAAEEVASNLKPNSGDDIDNLADPEKVTPEEAAKFLTEHPKAVPYVMVYLEQNPKILENSIKKLARNQPMMKKTVTFGQVLAIVGITVPVSLALGGIISANLGAISAGLGAVGAGLAVAGPTIGFFLAGLAGLIAIAALGIAAHKYRDKIKGGAEDIGKKVKDLLKNILVKLPIGVTNAQEFYKNVTNKDAQNELNPQGNPLSDKTALVGQYLSEDGLAALREYITDNQDDNGEITLPDGSKLTVGDLNKLETKSKGYFGIGKDEFRKVLKKIAPIMNQGNVESRKKIEKIQDAIHEDKNRQTPLPSSPLRTDSVANNALLALFDDDKRKDMNDLLQSIVGEYPELKDGLNKEFRQDFYEVLSEEPYKLDRGVLNKLEEKGGEGLTDLVTELKKLGDNEIKDLKEEVKKLKNEQKKGPRKAVKNTEASKAEGPSQSPDV